ncbi:hypothetical protein CAPTEDRAFT_18392 [Capitella teleta]|uniref:Guanylate kinase-like domain-containing protein n=1 Tax=Capitella teleta TaxID=283909 RepID=R7VBV1_CAPTE|nr:hypothetical protein CAPTEDRAFT_18392 [Capitella teleta]|eukprot:ELU16313.1 hypothetical protein CAPTEDRAFT_18392 [Capitella teleta]
MASLTGTLTFLINPSLDQHTAQKEEQLVHIRAHFNYDPEEDIYIPCKELGISFVRGDILHIINQDDPNWWQAYREGEEDQALAGLIPSRTFQEQREIIRHTLMAEGKDGAKGKKSKCNSCGRKHNKKNQKRKLYSSTGEDLDAEEILTYEEVALYYPQPNRKRPIVLIGPPNVGRQELRERLMETYPDRFGAAIPHTSRPRDDNEMDGKDYHFVPRHVFEADIIEHKFVEYGEFEKHLFGTSLEAIRQVVSSGRICVLNLHPESLRVLKASDMKPYILFVAPPNIDKLRQLRLSQGVIKVSDEELTEIIEKGRELEETYGHFFDHIITNFDLDRTYDELRGVIDQLEVEPQWVPAHWVT